MWVCAVFFSFFISPCWGKVVSLDICSDAWILENFSEQEIGGMTFLSVGFQNKIGCHHPVHRGTTEEILSLAPRMVVSEFPPNFRQQQQLEKHKIVLKLLPPLHRLEDLKKRFPKDHSLLFPSIGRKRVVFFMTENLHSPGGNTLWNDVLECLGFVNGTTILGYEGWAYISTEHILFAKPDFLIVFGKNVVLPASLNAIPKRYISSWDSLCPSPSGVRRLIEKLR